MFNYLGSWIQHYSGQLAASCGRTGWDRLSEEQESACQAIGKQLHFGGELVLNWSYSAKHYNLETISKVAEEYISQLQALISHCLKQEQTGEVYTPSDYGLGAEVTYQELDKFLETPYKEKQVKDYTKAYTV